MSTKNSYNIKPGKKGLLAICFLFFSSVLNAQTYVSAPMTSTPASGEYYSNSSIMLSPNFSFAASSGQSLRLYIDADCTPQTTALSNDQNYIMTSIPRVGGMKTTSDLPNRTTCELMQAVQYFDGLGRPLQTVQVKGSTGVKDVVQPFMYDQFDREAQKYLPYVAGTSDGSYKADALTSGAGIFNFYNPTGTPITQTQLAGGIPHITTPYASTIFEPSPLNRVTEQGAPGDTWQPNASNPDLSHTSRIAYGSNDATDISAVASTFKVMLYKVNIAADGTRTLANAGTNAYVAGQLYVTITKDENWQTADLRAGTVQEFKNKDGQVVLKRAFNKKPDNNIEVLSTYYVYDDFGLLCYVLPPGASPDEGNVNQTTLDHLCYQYRYDERNRLIEKKLPGKGKEFMVYNKQDQVVMVQDAGQRSTANQQWMVAKYDALGRVVVTGLYTHAGSTANTEYRAAMQTVVSADLNFWEIRISGGNGYNTAAGLYRAYPTTLNTTLSVIYYDTYDIPNLPSTYDKHLEATVSSRSNGLQTASLIKVLDGTTGSTDMLWNVNYYDDEGQNIRSFSQHFKGGVVSLNNYDEITNTYDFTHARLTSSRSNYINNGTSKVTAVTVNTEYEYDHMGRKTDTWQEINGVKILLSQAVYNEIGQLIDKKLHSANNGQSFVQSVDYRYNSRGWLKSINNAALTNDGLLNNDTGDAFGEELSHEDYGTAALKQYNGNISSIKWQSKVPALSTVPQALLSYEYNYDRINRLTKANLTTAGLVGQYNEVVGYDVMGNIRTLSRFQGNAITPIDQLAYTYENGNNSNRLQSVADGSGNDLGQLNGTTSYINDVNGNLLTDSKKQLTFTYNHLNLPYTITKAGTGAGVITYIYDAGGRKLRKVLTGANRDYVNGIEYDNNGTLAFIQTEEGRARPNGGSYFYEYMLKDHLGNTRVMIGQDGVVGQQTDYYAFGMEMNRGTNVAPSPDNKYKYNGKELQAELSMNLYDYGARFFDPVIARWTSVDPLAEQERKASPYNYTFDDPIRHTDPDGMFGEDVNSDDGDGGCCKTAKLIFGTGLVVGGTMVVGAAPTGVGEVVAVPLATVTVLTTTIVSGFALIYDALTDRSSNNSTPEPVYTPPTILQGASLKNRLPKEGIPNTVVTNKPGTTTKVYGPNGKEQKEHNKGHPEVHTPPNEKEDHVHDHKPNPNPGNPNKTDRQKGRKPKPNEKLKDEAKAKRRQEEQQQQQNNTNSGN
jgi:RHS repeat-associated protein